VLHIAHHILIIIVGRCCLKVSGLGSAWNFFERRVGAKDLQHFLLLY
jgi:hypothetical protein